MQAKLIKELTNPPPNDWHSWFYALLHIVLFKFQSVDIQREVVLGAQPPRADFVVVREDDSTDSKNGGTPDLGLQVFHIFRKTNVIEFKNPDDELSEGVLWKVVGYAGFYIAKYGTSPNEITLTLLRSTKPVKMFKEMAQFVEADETKGIYHIRNWKVDFPIQVIVSRELEGKEYAGFRAITKNPKLEDIQQIIPFSAGTGISWNSCQSWIARLSTRRKGGFLKWLRHGERYLNLRLMSGLGMR